MFGIKKNSKKSAKEQKKLLRKKIDDKEIEETEADEGEDTPKKAKGKSRTSLREKTEAVDRVLYRIMPVILGVVAVFSMFCLITPESSGKVGMALSSLLRGIFSVGAYLVPVFVGIAAFFWRSDTKNHKRLARFILSLIAVSFFSAIVYLITVSSADRVFEAGSFYSMGKDLSGGGFFGSLLGYGLYKGVGNFGAWMLSIAALLLYAITFLRVNFDIRSIGASIKDKLKSSAKNYSEKRKKALEEYGRELEEEEKARLEESELEKARKRALYDNVDTPERVALPDPEKGRKILFELDDDRLLDDNINTPMRAPALPRHSATVRFNGGRIQLDDDDSHPIIADDDFDIAEIDQLLSPLKIPEKKKTVKEKEYTITTDAVTSELRSLDDFENITEYSEGASAEGADEKITDESYYTAPVFSARERVSIFDEPDTDKGDATPYIDSPSVPNGTSFGRDNIMSFLSDDTDSDSEDNSSEYSYDGQRGEEDFDGTADSEYGYDGTEDYGDSDSENFEDADDSDYTDTEDEPALSPFARPAFERKEAPISVKVTKPFAEPAKKAPEYQMPPLSLLEASKPPINDNSEYEIRQKSEILEKTFENLKLPAKVVNISKGPRITRYELTTDQTIDVKKYARAISNISMNLESAGIRMETPIPGKRTVGVEVPNKISSLVYLRDMIDTDEFREAKSTTTICVGADVTGQPVYGDIAKMPHMLIAGATGMGKSVCINIIITSILYKARPDEVKLILIDPKKVEFIPYRGIPHLLVPVVTDAKKAAGALSWAVNEMERRYDLIEEAGVRNIEGYNEYAKKHTGFELLPKLVIIIDELNDLMMMARDTVESSIMRITQKARAAGIHLIIGTQRPSVNVITGVIKANIPSRIAFKVTSNVDSRTIFDSVEVGAEKLLSKGDMIYFPVTETSPRRVQGAFMSDSEVDSVVSFLRDNSPENAYDSDVWDDIENEARKCDASSKRSAGDGDAPAASKNDLDSMLANEQFRRAVELAVNNGEISASKIITELEIGFQKASRFVTYMQNFGIVSEPNGQKPRKTLIDHNQFIEMLNNMEDSE